MSALRQRIIETIRVNGPMPVSLYMLMCLHDPTDGYYAVRPGFNHDFTTAPETSQVFGELLGLWAAHEWLALGKPSKVHLVELGPGRATMMADMLRAAASVPGFIDAAQIGLIEASPALRQVQADRLSAYTIKHYDDLDGVPPGPSIIIGNEFLDCLAIRQFVRDGNGWRERQVGLGMGNTLKFGIGPPAELPPNVIPVGDHVEYAPALDTLISSIARRFRQGAGRVLFIDYGPADCSPGDTLRAYRAGKQVDPLEDPGVCDLTADVDFPRLRQISLSEGLAVHGPISQGNFLLRLGARERGQFLAKANPQRDDEIREALQKLISASEMGERFRAIALTPHMAATPPGF